MRILFVLHQFYPEFGGGTEHVTLNLARMAQRGGHYVEVLAGSLDPARLGEFSPDAPIAGCVRKVVQGLPVLFVPRALLPPSADVSFDPAPELVRDLAQWMVAQSFDVVHVMHTMRMGSAVLAAQQAGIPYVVTLTDFFLPCSRINLVNAAGKLCAGPDHGARCASDCLAAPWTAAAFATRYRQAQSLLAGASERCVPSPFVASRCEAAFPGLDFRVLPHGIDLLQLGAGLPAYTEASRAGRLRLLYVGSIIEQKGLDVLLRALAGIPDAPLELTVVGGAWGNPAYHAEVNALGQADARVTFAGKLAAPEVFARMRAADLLCLPSQVPESFSLVLHEAAAAGIPALVSDLGAPADFVARHRCGLAVPPPDPSAWAQAITRVLQAPENLVGWKSRLPLPLRVEEEAFFYETLYRRVRQEARAR